MESSHQGGIKHINRKATVVVFSGIFLVNCMCIHGAFVIQSYIYDSIGLRNMGQMTMLLIWLSYSVGILYTKQVLKMFDELKTCLFVGWLITGLPILIVMQAYVCHAMKCTTGVCSNLVIQGLNIVVALVSGGIACTWLWTGQYEFINRVSAEKERKSHFSLFYSMLQFAGIFANLFNVCFYSYEMNTLICFAMFYILYLTVSFAIPYLVPSINNYDPEADAEQTLIEKINDLGIKEIDPKGLEKTTEIKDTQVLDSPSINPSSSMISTTNADISSIDPVTKEAEQTSHLNEITPSFKEAFKCYYDLSRTPGMMKVLPFMLQGGMVQMFGYICLYRFVVQVYEGTGATDSHVKKMICLQAILFAIGGMFSSQLVKLVPANLRDKAMVAQSWTISGTMLLLYIASLHGKSLSLAMVPAFLIGASEIGKNQLMSVYTAEEYPCMTEAFALYKQIQNLICAVLVVFYIYVSGPFFFFVNSLSFVVLSCWFTKLMLLNHNEECSDIQEDDKSESKSNNL